MTDSVTIAWQGWWTRLARLWSLQPCSSNRLMRPSDRIESAVRIIATIVALIAVPVAGAFGTHAYTDTSAEIRTEDATRFLVQPVITEGPSSIASHRYQARVRWDQDGRSGTAVIPVRETAQRGDRIDLWLDDHGAPAAQPRHPDVAVVTGIGVGVFVLIGVWLCGWCLMNGATLLLQRRRSARWDREWRQMSRATKEGSQ